MFSDELEKGGFERCKGFARIQAEIPICFEMRLYENSEWFYQDRTPFITAMALIHNALFQTKRNTTF